MASNNFEEKIEIKMIDVNDAKEVFKSIDSDRQRLKKYLPWVQYTKTVDDTMDFIKDSKRKYRSNNGFDSGIWYKGEYAGMIGYHSLDKKIKSIGIGYWLNSQYTGKGIATYACRQFVRYAFNILKMNRVEIRCAEGNLPSRSIPERLGFKQEGVIRDGELVEGKYVNAVIYGMLRRDKINKK